MIRVPLNVGLTVTNTRGRDDGDFLDILTTLTILAGVKIERVGTLEAKTRLSELLDQVERGKRFQITRHGRPIAELSPVTPRGRKAKPGFAKGTFVYISPNFDDPLEDFADYT